MARTKQNLRKTKKTLATTIIPFSKQEQPDGEQMQEQLSNKKARKLEKKRLKKKRNETEGNNIDHELHTSLHIQDTE
jgi:hypothetical protein